jgi:hypothetical protein
VAQEAKVKVKLDTRQAKADIDALGKGGAAAAGRVNDRLNRPSGVAGGGRAGRSPATGGPSVGRSFGAGAALGAGVAVGQGVFSFIKNRAAETIAEATSGTEAMLQAGLGVPEARGLRRTREEAKAIFGRSGDVEGAVSWFNSVKGLRIAEEKTNNEIDQRIGGKDVLEKTTGVAGEVVSAISQAADKITDFMGNFFGGR